MACRPWLAFDFGEMRTVGGDQGGVEPLVPNHECVCGFVGGQIAVERAAD